MSDLPTERGVLRRDDGATPSQSFDRAGRWLARVAMAVSGIVILGWIADLELAVRVLPGRPRATLAATVGGLLLAGSVLLLERPEARRWRGWLGQGLAALVVLVSAAFLLAAAAGFALPIAFEETGVGVWPSLPAAVTLLLLSLAALSLDVGPRWRVRPSEVLAALGGLVAYTDVATHAYGATHLYRATPDSLTTFAIAPAVMMLLVTGSLLLARSDRGAVSAFAAPLQGGFIARRIALVALALPIVFGVLVGLVNGLLDELSAIALVSVTSSLLALILLAALARSLNRADLERRRGEEGARRLASIVENTEDAVVAVGADTRVRSWNAAAERLFGIPASDAVGTLAGELGLTPGDRADETETLIRRALRGEAVVGFETQRVRRGDGIVHVSFTVSPIRADNGEIVGTSTIGRDITPRARAEQALRESEERYRAVVENATDAIFVAALDGGFTEVNERGAAMLGCTREEILARTIMDFIDERDAPRLALHREAVLRGETVSADWHMRRDDGGWVEVEVRSRILPDGRWLGIVRDIAERNELTRALEAARDAERDLRRRLEQWSSVIAHELRQPISVIELSTAVLERAVASGAAVQGPIARLRGACERLRRMTEELLDVSRLEVSQMKLRLDRVELPALLEEMARDCASLQPERNVRIERHGDVPPVLADPARIEQVLGNLLSNAVKYGAPGSEIVVTLERSGADAVVSVTNAGAGIPEAEQRLLFERFHRARGAHASGVEGLGLGLYISKGLVEAHGGHIWVESVPGATTTFTFTVPLANGSYDGRVPARA